MISARTRAGLVALVIFVLGGAAGSAITTWAGVKYFREIAQSATEPRLIDRVAARIGSDLTQNLNLSTDESARLQKILDDSAVRLRNLRAQSASQAFAELRATQLRIAAELPPEKRGQYRRLMMQRYQRLGLAPPRFDPGP